jgi:hypothetical protein
MHERDETKQNEMKLTDSWHTTKMNRKGGATAGLPETAGRLVDAIQDGRGVG